MTTTIQEYSPTEAALVGLREKYGKTVYDVSTPTGMNAAKVARKELSTYRIDLEKLRKEIKAPALDRCRQIDDEAKRITAELVALEDPIDYTITEEENRLKALQAEKARKEAERRQGIMTKIARFRGVAAAMTSPSNTSVVIKETLQKVEDAVIDEVGYNEFFAEAVEVRKSAVDALIDLIAAVEEREAEQVRLKAEREELEELRRQNAERLAKEQKEQNDRLALEREEQEKERARREKEQNDRLALEREEQEKERARLEKEQTDRLALEREEQEKERARLEKEQTDRLALERESLRKENETTQEKLRLENEAQDKIRIQQDKQAEELRLKEAELAAQKKQQEAASAAHLERVKKLQAAKKDTPVAALAAILEICKTEGCWVSMKDSGVSRNMILDLAEANLPVAPDNKKPGPGKSVKVSK
jgi:hypothetical protein